MTEQTTLTEPIPYPDGLPPTMLDDPQLPAVWAALCSGLEVDLATFKGYNSPWVWGEVSAVAMAMAETGAFPELSWTLSADTDGVLGGFEVGVYHPATNTYLQRYSDTSAVVEHREASGSVAAVEIGLFIAHEHAYCQAVAARLDAPTAT